MGEIRFLSNHPEWRSVIDSSRKPSHDKKMNNGGGGGGMSDLERRVATLETDVRAIRDDVHELKTDVAVIKANSANYATKADLAELKADVHEAFVVQNRWLMTSIIGAIGLAVGIVTWIQRSYPVKVEAPSVQITLPPEFYQAIKPEPPPQRIPEPSKGP